MRPIAVLGLVLPILWTSPGWADDAPSGADAAAIRGVIQQQLDAFRNNDGGTAEALASQGIRDKFPTPDVFMGMVRNSYGALIRPRSTEFGDLSQTALGPVQKMTVVDDKGVVWTVGYTMTLVDGVWRISGCYLIKTEAVGA